MPTASYTFPRVASALPQGESCDGAHRRVGVCGVYDVCGVCAGGAGGGGGGMSTTFDTDGGGPLSPVDEEVARAEADRNARNGARSTCALLVITVIFVLSLYWAADSWSRVGRDRGRRWKERVCAVEFAGVERGVRAGGKEPFWRTRFEVAFSVQNTDSDAGSTGVTGGSNSETTRNWDGIVAWRYGSSVFNVTETVARQYSTAFELGQKYPCWTMRDGTEGGSDDEPVVENDGWRASMSAVGMSNDSDIDLALVSTFLVGVLLLVFLVALVYAVSVAEGHAGVGANLPPATGTVQPGCLTKSDIDKLCEVAEAAAASDPDISALQASGAWDCAICLDDDGGEGGRLARLACRHTFHGACARAWLARGGVTCPLCNMRLRPPDNSANEKHGGTATDDDSQDFDSDGSGVDQNSATVEPGLASTLASLPDLALAIMGLSATPPEPAFRGLQCAERTPTRQSPAGSRSTSTDSHGENTCGDSGGSGCDGAAQMPSALGSVDGAAGVRARLAQARRRHSGAAEKEGSTLLSSGPQVDAESSKASAKKRESVGKDEPVAGNIADVSAKERPATAEDGHGDGDAGAIGEEAGEQGAENGGFEWPSPDKRPNEKNERSPY